MIEHNMTSECVEKFIEKSLLKHLKSGNILLLDNAPVHNIERIKSILKPHNIHVMLLPKYSPEYSPIELFWSKLKSIIRSLKPESIEELFDSLQHGCSMCDEDDFENWHEHCGWDTMIA